MYCDVCGDLIASPGRTRDRAMGADPGAVFVDLCSHECAAAWRAERERRVTAPTLRWPPEARGLRLSGSAIPLARARDAG